MKCLACDCILSDFEATRKYTSGDYVDLCNRCFSQSDMGDILVIEREDLKEYEDIFTEDEDTFTEER